MGIKEGTKEKIKKYIRSARNRGVTDKQTKANLIKVGWSSGTIKEILKELNKKSMKEKRMKEKRKKPFIVRFILGLTKLILKISIWFVIAVIIALALIIVAAIFAYNNLPLATVTFCISNNSVVLPIDCSVKSDCIRGISEVTETGGEVAGDITAIVFAFIDNNTDNIDMTEIDTRINRSAELLGGLLQKVFAEIGYCNTEGFCAVRKVRGIEEIFTGEAINCTANEEKRIIKITPKTLIPPYKVTQMIKNIVESKEIRNQLITTIKTRKLPNLEK